MKKVIIFFLSLFLTTNVIPQSATTWKELTPAELNLDNFENIEIEYTDKSSGAFWFYHYDAALNKAVLKSIDNKTYDVTDVRYTTKPVFLIHDDLVFLQVNIRQNLNNVSSARFIQWFKPVDKVSEIISRSQSPVLPINGKVVSSDTCLYSLIKLKEVIEGRLYDTYEIYVVNFDPFTGSG